MSPKSTYWEEVNHTYNFLMKSVDEFMGEIFGYRVFRCLGR